MGGKFEVKHDLADYRGRVGEFRVVDVPERQYLMVDGHGDPNVAPAYAEALAALYPMAYRLKFLSRRELGRDYVVPPLEGLWWSTDLSAFTTVRDKSRWDWTMMIHLPQWIGRAEFDTVRDAVGPAQRPVRWGDVRRATLTEGRCVQTLHVGSYDDEGPVLARLHDEVIPGHGWRPTGKHHEIYLSDPRRTVPERLRTILRQPVRAPN